MHPQEISKPSVSETTKKPFVWQPHMNWEKAANELARSYAPTIYTCKACKGPRMEGHGCSYCGDVN